MIGPGVCAAVVAELADLATYSPAHEMNPVTIGLGPLAPAAKLALVVLIVALAVALGAIPDRRTAIARRVLLALATFMGILGTISNL